MQKILVALLLIFSFTFVSCGSKVNTITINDPKLESLRIVKLKVEELPKIDVSEYKNIHFYAIKKENGEVEFLLKENDAKSLINLLQDLSSYIKLREYLLKEFKNYYESVLNESVSREKNNSGNFSTSREIQMDRK